MFLKNATKRGYGLPRMKGPDGKSFDGGVLAPGAALEVPRWYADAIVRATDRQASKDAGLGAAHALRRHVDAGHLVLEATPGAITQAPSRAERELETARAELAELRDRSATVEQRAKAAIAKERERADALEKRLAELEAAKTENDGARGKRGS